MILFKQLNGNRMVGMNILEIVSFPELKTFGSERTIDIIKNIQNNFVKSIKEFFNLSELDQTVAELLWITDTVEKQTFRSSVRVFLLLRKLGKNKREIEDALTAMQNNYMTMMRSLQYQVVAIKDQSNFEEMLKKVSKECIYSIVKTEKCTANENSLFPYYYSDIVPLDNTDNFQSIVSALSQIDGCCLSFQLFPTSFTQQESYCLNEMSTNLSNIASGVFIERGLYKDISATEPAKALAYYNEHVRAPLFQYNILVFGKRRDCAGISSKVISLLQSGNNKIVNADFGCYDLTNEKVNLERDILYYPWNVNNRLIYYYRNMRFLQSVGNAILLKRLPYIMTYDEAGAFFRLPIRDKGMNALKSNQVGQMVERFAAEVVDEDNIQFGKLITNEMSDVVIGCPVNTFTKHALIVGVPGSGKTTFAIHLLLQFYKKDIPFLAIEPTKSEYRGMIDAIPDIQIFTPGNNAVSPFIINPFIPPRGIRIEQYIPSLASAFKAAFSMPSPLDVIFMRAIHSCYTEYGWKDYSKYGDPDVRYFGLYEFILVFKKIIAESGYGGEVKGNLESGGVFRLLNLIEQNSNIYDTINTVPIEDILHKPTVIELNAIDNTEQKALIMALLLINICVYTKNNQLNDGQIKNALLIDEAHVLFGGNGNNLGDKADAQGTTIKALQDMIAEIRSYGTSIIIADQSPAKVSREIVAQTEIKIAFRLVQAIEKEIIGDSTNMDENQQQQLSRLKTGEAYVYYGKLDIPQLVMTEDIRAEERIQLNVDNQEIEKRMTYWNERKKILRPYVECDFCEQCKENCDFYVRSNADYYANKLFSVCKKNIKDNHKFVQYLVSMEELIGEPTGDFNEDQYKRLFDCIRIKFVRKMQLETPYRVKRNVLQAILAKKSKKEDEEDGY
ncbi:MAG: ATP-binding protein [Lachnospiraceae bacterium]|nr:ATP-binding protein [Lachnospiraceae bacterium]